MHAILIKRWVCLLFLASLPWANSFAAAGKFNFVIGDVRVVGTTGERRAVRGGEVEANDTVVSGKDGMAQLRLTDGAFIALRADTVLRIDKYHYDSKKPESNDTVLSLAKGTMRAFTGAIANFNKDRFKMKTKTATVGIRGSGNVLNFSPVDNLTLNHTIEGSHTITTFDPSGAMRTLVTMPGQTVQVNQAGTIIFVPTPAYILDAVTTSRKNEPEPAKTQGQNETQVSESSPPPAPASDNTQQTKKEKSSSPQSTGQQREDGAPAGDAAAPRQNVNAGEAPSENNSAPLGSAEASGMGSGRGVSAKAVPPGAADVYGTGPVMNGGTGGAADVYGTAPMMPAPTSQGEYGAGEAPGIYGATTLTAPMMAGGTTSAYNAASTAMMGANSGVPFVGESMTFGGWGGVSSSTLGIKAPGVYAPATGYVPTYMPTYTAYNPSATYMAYSPTAYIPTALYTPIYTAYTPTTTGYTPTTTYVFCTTGSVSGSLYCDAGTWITPVLGRACTGFGTAGAFTCSGGIWVSNTTNTTTTTWGTACSTAGTVSGTLYCNGSTWITPTIGSACTGTGTAGAFTCSGGVWISNTTNTTTTTWGTACSAAGTVSGTLYCNGSTWITPTIGSACTGTGTAGAFTCSGSVWTSGSSTAILGGACSGIGAVSGLYYCNGSTWASVSTSSAAATAGGACTAGSVSGDYYCNVSTWATPAVSTSCSLTSGTVVGSFVCSTGFWAATTYATPAGAVTPTVGTLYDAYGAQVTIPANGYRNVLYSYAATANSTAIEVALDTLVMTAGVPTTSFSAPSKNGSGTSSTNAASFATTSSIVDFGYDAATGMSWGRWQGSWLSTQGTAVTASTTSNLHWFATRNQTQAITLPVTGVWNYTLVGKTSPTDNTGVVGTLNSASFSANFTAQTVTVGINVSMPSSTASTALPVTLDATASNVAILSGGNFKTTSPTVTCSGGGCASSIGSGVIAGQFAAPLGAGVGVGYGLTNGSQTVNGVAIFRH